MNNGCLRHLAASLCARAQVPDPVVSMVLGHTLAHSQSALRHQPSVDKNLRCYTRGLLQTVEDQLRVARTFAHTGNIPWHTPLDESLVVAIRDRLPACIHPNDLDAEEIARKLLFAKNDDDDNDFLKTECAIPEGMVIQGTNDEETMRKIATEPRVDYAAAADPVIFDSALKLAKSLDSTSPVVSSSPACSMPTLHIAAGAHVNININSNVQTRAL